MITTERTIVPGPPDHLGWRDLRAGPGENHVGRAIHPRSRPLLALAHLSDLHLCDAESPARQEYLDRHGDPGAPYADRLGVIGTYRPQEILTVHVAVSALAAVHRLGAGPTTARPLDAVLVTGDVTDNAQTNELRWYADIMAGRSVEPRSGAPSSSDWVGAPTAPCWSEHYWHPDGSGDPRLSDLPTARWGYPAVPGLVEAARRTVASPGAALPWLTVHGNHDALLQGTVPASADLCALAVGETRIEGLGSEHTPLAVLDATAPVGPARYTHDRTSPTSRITADPGREIGTRQGFVAATSGGRGAPTSGERGTYWSADVGHVRLIALDTVNPHGGWQGSIDTRQLTWLADELADAAGRYVLITSHHPSWTLVNPHQPDGSTGRHTASDVLTLLLRHRGVIAWIAGHVHAHSHQWHQAPDRVGGLWEITTSSLVDWPQQLRSLEIVREPRGEIAIVSTVIDHPAGAAWTLTDLDDVTNLAAVSRSLAVNDYRGRAGRVATLAGAPSDRNAVWRVPDPFG